MEAKFFDSLFEGDSANGSKLGTGLTGGDFWPRIDGCSLLYRGLSISTMDFENILAVGDSDAFDISSPSYVQHGSDTIYFYVVRRANKCGDLERTLAASARVRIDANGDLASPQPNDVFALIAEEMAGSKVQLIWSYCPLEQESEPANFKVYYDAGTGQVDYQNPLVTIPYKGKRFYTYQSAALNPGKYLFAVRAEDATGIEDGCLAQSRVELGDSSPAAIDILNAETI